MTNQKINKKVINATEVTVNGVKYRSKLEARCAQILKENNISFEYEPLKIEYIPKFEYYGEKYRAAFYTVRSIPKSVAFRMHLGFAKNHLHNA